MPSLWDILRAIRGSDLPAIDRHIVMTLASLADPETGIIPDRFSPSLTELARFTGLGRSTVARRMPFIEDSGWVKKNPPPVQAAWRDKERNAYQLFIPTSPGAGLVPQRDQSTSPGAGPVLVPERDTTSPAAGHVLRPSTNTTTTSSSSDKPRKAKKPKKVEPPREDVERICRLLADLVEANGSKRPTVTATWRREARLLLDEKRTPPTTVDKVIALINWCQADAFWKGNIRGMPKFRAQYDALRLKALAEYEQAKKREAATAAPAPPRNGSVPADERCPKHRGQRKDACGLCRSEKLPTTARRTA